MILVLSLALLQSARAVAVNDTKDKDAALDHTFCVRCFCSRIFHCNDFHDW